MSENFQQEMVISLYSEFGTGIYVGFPVSSLARNNRCRSAEAAYRLCQEWKDEGLLRFLSEGQAVFVGNAHVKFGVGPPPGENFWVYDEKWAQFVVSYHYSSTWERGLKLYLLTRGKPFCSLAIEPILCEVFGFKLVPQFLSSLAHSKKINYLLSQNLGRKNGGISYSWILVPSDGGNLLVALETEYGSPQTSSGLVVTMPVPSIRDRQRDREKVLAAQLSAANQRVSHLEQEKAKLQADNSVLRDELVKSKAKQAMGERKITKLSKKLKAIVQMAREAFDPE